MKHTLGIQHVSIMPYPVAFFLLPSARVPDRFQLESNPALGRAVSGKWEKMWNKRTGVVAKSVAEAVLSPAESLALGADH